MTDLSNNTLLLAIGKTLEEGITCHTQGKLADAERLYRSILESFPKHPDANHNMGVLLIQTNNQLNALPFFTRALEEEPKQKQYWLSYINTLLQLGDFDKAIQIIESARQSGLNEDEINAFLKTLNRNNPDHISLEALITAY